MKISTSMLSVTQDKKEKMNELNESITDYFHVDVMDGNFVSNNTVKEMDEFLNDSEKPLDIHLMVQDIKSYINKYISFQPKIITFHVEVNTVNLEECIDKVQANAILAGLAINPETDLELLTPYLEKIDVVLIMSVHPGKGGQSFMKEKTIQKLKQLQEKRCQNHLYYLIEVDGGINLDTISFVKDADIIVSGSYITNGNINENIMRLKEGK